MSTEREDWSAIIQHLRDGMRINAQPPRAPVQSPPVRLEALRHAVDAGFALANIATSLPPMTRQSGLKRQLAMAVGKGVLRLSQIVLQQQRDFNMHTLAVLRLFIERTAQSEQRCNVLEAHTKTLTQDVAELKEMLNAQT